MYGDDGGHTLSLMAGCMAGWDVIEHVGRG